MTKIDELKRNSPMRRVVSSYTYTDEIGYVECRCVLVCGHVRSVRLGESGTGRYAPIPTKKKCYQCRRARIIKP